MPHVATQTGDLESSNPEDDGYVSRVDSSSSNHETPFKPPEPVHFERATRAWSPSIRDLCNRECLEAVIAFVLFCLLFWNFVMRHLD
jgi:hypothetical protein